MRSTVYKTLFDWYGTEMTEKNNPPVARTKCWACTEVMDGTRFNQDPHEYLVFTSARSLQAEISFYKCLICGALPMLDRSGKIPRWIF